MGGPEVGAMVMEGGVLYGGENSPVLAVDTLNPITGVATTGSDLIGTSSGDFFALAPNPVPVPEPSTWWMISVGGVALLGIMLRKKHRTA